MNIHTFRDIDVSCSASQIALPKYQKIDQKTLIVATLIVSDLSQFKIIEWRTSYFGIFVQLERKFYRYATGLEIFCFEICKLADLKTVLIILHRNRQIGYILKLKIQY